MNILITGATGFIGSRLATALRAWNCHNLSLVCRKSSSRLSSEHISIDAINAHTDWARLLLGSNCVIHTAARAHVMEEEVADSSAVYRDVNVEGVHNLARQAASAGVQRFIFISSIGVNGNMNTNPFTAYDSPMPAEPYAESKLEAEIGLRRIARETDMELVVIRPPLVYGPNAPGNFGRLVRFVARGLPLPFGGINNRRSLIALDNLVDLIITCIDHPAAANQIFLAADGQDLSTTELLQGVARAMGKPSRLIPVPESLLMLVASVVGKRGLAQRLLGSLQVDISKTRDLLGWEPPISVEEGLRRCFDPSRK